MKFEWSITELYLHWDGDYVTIKTQETVNFYICKLVISIKK